MQVSSFTARDLKAAFVSAEDCDREVIKGIHGGEYQLVLNPIIISNLSWREMLWTQVYQQHLVAFPVDEAHCVSKWLVAMYLLSILGKRAIQACFKYYCIRTYITCFWFFFIAILQEEIFKIRSLIPPVTTCPLTGAATRNEVITTLRMVEQYHPTNQTMHKVSEKKLLLLRWLMKNKENDTTCPELSSFVKDTTTVQHFTKLFWLH